MCSTPLSSSARQPIQGFTLLELLVALTLASLLMAAVSGLIYQVGESLQRSDRVRVASERLALVEALLRRKIEGLKPLGTVVDGSATLWFQGDPDAVQLLATLPEHPTQPRLYHFRFQFVPERKQLQAALVPWEGRKLPHWDTAETVLLLEGVERVQWRYQAFDTGEWQDTWHDRRFHPARVSLSFTLTSGQTATWVFVLPRAR